METWTVDRGKWENPGNLVLCEGVEKEVKHCFTTGGVLLCYNTNLKIDNGSVRTETFICCFVEIPIPKLYKTI